MVNSTSDSQSHLILMNGLTLKSKSTEQTFHCSQHNIITTVTIGKYMVRL